MMSIIGAVESMGDPDLLIEVQQALTAALNAQRAAAGAGWGTVDEEPTDEGRGEPPDVGRRHHDSQVATIAGCLTSVAMLRMRHETDSDRRSALLGELTGALDGCPVYTESVLDVAKALFEDGQVDRAETLVARMDLHSDLAVSDLGYDSPTDTLLTRFRYWRLRHLIAAQPEHGGVFRTNQSRPEYPCGQRDRGRRRDPLEHRSDRDRGEGQPSRPDPGAHQRRLRPQGAGPLHEAWTDIVPVLSIFGRTTIRTNATVSGLSRHRSPLLGLVVKVAAEHSPGLAQKVVDILDIRIADDPGTWPTKLRLSLARKLRRAGIAAPWHDAALAQEEIDAEGLDAHSRLQDTASLVDSYSR